MSYSDVDPYARQGVHPAIPTVGFILLAVTGFFGAVMHTATHQLVSEYRVDKAIEKNLVPKSLFDPLAKGINVLFSPPGAIAVIVALGVVMWLWKKNFLFGLRYAALAGCGWLVAEAFKMAFSEPRPQVLGLSVGRWLISETGRDSFPSGHTAAVAAVFVACVLVVSRRRSRVLFIVFGIVATAIVAISRLYLGVHYVTDTIASVVAATGMVFVAYWLWDLVVVKWWKLGR